MCWILVEELFRDQTLIQDVFLRLRVLGESGFE